MLRTSVLVCLKFMLVRYIRKHRLAGPLSNILLLVLHIRSFHRDQRHIRRLCWSLLVGLNKFMLALYTKLVRYRIILN